MKPLFLIALATASGLAAAQTPVPSRGELLYDAHCVACHSQQMHWRARRTAVDWPSLKEQVALWQGRARLGWSDDDVTEVARHLNDTYYRYPVPAASDRVVRVSRAVSSRPSTQQAPVARPVNCQPPAALATAATHGGPAN